MKPRVVSFDCAQTLLAVDYSIKRYIADVAAEANLELPLEGPAIYEEMHKSRFVSYLDCNKLRNHEACDHWWIQLASDWLTHLGLDARQALTLHEVSQRIGFGENSILFRLYEDVVPTLDRLDELGIQTAVLSNWDYTLKRALLGAGIYDRFDLVVASLEYGVEKPDPLLFEEVTKHFQVEPGEVLHVGDDRVDDYQGAKSFGMRAALIDRSCTYSEDPYLHDLRAIEGAFDWNA